MKHTLFALLALSSFTACKKKPSETKTTEGSATTTTTTGSATGSATMGSGEGSGSAMAATPDAAAAEPEVPGRTTLAEGFSTPESATVDEANDRYIVANINGEPAGADDNGYILSVTGDGATTKWIDGTADNVKLDAPKGTAIAGATLFVADITVVRQFDAKSGAQKADIKIDGATFLNDVTPDGAGGVYVTDSGLDAKFQPTGTDAVWHINKDGKAKALIKDKDLGHPNGIIAGDKGSVWVVTFGTGEVYEVTAKGKKQAAQKLPKGQLDGIAAIGNGEYLVSSWEGKAVYRGKPGGEWKEVVSNIESPADIAWDAKRKRVLIPVFTGNKLVMQTLE